MKIQRKRMLWRVPLVVTILYALFWGVWYLITGEIPVVSEIKWIDETTIHLPFRISRLWDIIFVPIWVFIFVFLFTDEIDDFDEKLLGPLLAGLIMGGIFLHDGILMVSISILGFSLLFNLILTLTNLSLGNRPIIELLSGLIINLNISLGAGLIISLVAGLGFGFAAALGLSLSADLMFILVFVLILGLIYGLKFLFLGLIYGLKFLFSKKFWNWIANISKNFWGWVTGEI